MDLLKKSEIHEVVQLGRTNWRAIGNNAVLSDSVSCGFARFSLKDGKMIPHKHEREIIYVVDAKGVAARYGMDREHMDETKTLSSGDLLRFHDGEWHMFEMENEESYLDILWLFSVPQNHVVDAPDA